MTLSRKHITTWFLTAIALLLLASAPCWAAQVLLIKAETAKDGLQYIGDVVGVFSDSHIFSDHELKVFGVVTIKGTKEEVRAKIREITPEIADAYLWPSDGKYHWEEPVTGPWTIIQVYQVEGSLKWHVLENDFKFPANISTLTPEEKQLLETVDVKDFSVDNIVRKIVKDVTTLPNNGVELKELKSVGPSQ